VTPSAADAVSTAVRRSEMSTQGSIQSDQTNLISADTPKDSPTLSTIATTPPRPRPMRSSDPTEAPSHRHHRHRVRPRRPRPRPPLHRRRRGSHCEVAHNRDNGHCIRIHGANSRDSFDLRSDNDPNAVAYSSSRRVQVAIGSVRVAIRSPQADLSTGDDELRFDQVDRGSAHVAIAPARATWSVTESTSGAPTSASLLTQSVAGRTKPS
jgi:hypothetical protein